MAYLLDVNVLIALFNPNHVHHTIARKWFIEKGANNWATCAITENGLLRIMSNPASGSLYNRPAQVAEHLSLLKEKYLTHHFLKDSLSLTDGRIINLSCIMSWKHLTDAYLLGLAYSNQLLLATFDKRISTNWLQDKNANIIELL